MAVEILLSTYNGEKYLPAFLDSLFSQTNQDWLLRIRDDGSSDNTLAVVKSYSDAHPGRVVLQKDELGNIKPKRSFEELLKACEADYIFFADEDDVWLPEKVEHTLAKMKESEMQTPNLPIVVCTDLKVADGDLNIISDSMWHYSRICPQLFHDKDYSVINPVATGCTMLINKAARGASLPFHAMARMHDGWIVMRTVLSGGRLVPLFESTMLYRQHNGNQIGALYKEKGFFRKKLSSIRETWNYNCQQWASLKVAGYPSLLRYLFYKAKFVFSKPQ